MTGSRSAEGCEAFAVAEVTVGAATGLAVRGEVELATAPARRRAYVRHPTCAVRV